MALTAQAQQARLAADLQAKMTGVQVPVALDAEKVASQKAKSAEALAARAEAAEQRLTAQYAAQKELLTLEAQRSMDLYKSQMAAQRQQSALALDQQLKQQSLA